MAESELRVDLFVEDEAQHLFCRYLITGLAKSKGLAVDVSLGNAQGGKGKALTRFRGYQQALAKGKGRSGPPDLLVIIVDANCHGHQEAKRDVTRLINSQIFPRTVVGCPDPHIERWFLADSAALKKIFSTAPALPAYKCERNFYKQLFARTIESAGFSLALGGAEYAAQIVAAMDLSRPICDSSLADLISDLNAALTRIQREKT